MHEKFTEVNIYGVGEELIVLRWTAQIMFDFLLLQLCNKNKKNENSRFGQSIAREIDALSYSIWF